MRTPKRTRVDVLGAGISGLASAYFLAKSDVPLELHVWEKDASAGGLAGSFSTEHFAVEKFYHHLFVRDVALTELIGELGLGDDLEWRGSTTGSYFSQGFFRLSSPLDLLRFKPLSVVDRVRLAWLMVHARRIKDWRELDDLTVREYVTRVAGARVYEVLWEPLFRGKFGRYADTISAAWLWAKLVERGGSRSKGGKETLGYLRGGLGRVFDVMIERLEERGHRVHLNTAVQALQCDADGAIESLTTDEGIHPTDCVVSGLQLPQLAAALPDRLVDYRASISRIPFLATVCLVLTLRRSLSQFYWTNVSDPSFPFVGIVEQTRWADRADFSDKHVAYVSAYVSPDDPRLEMTADELVQHYLPWVQRMFPDFTLSDIEATSLWKAPYTQPVVRPGYRHLIPDVRTPSANLFVCTMAQIYPSDRQVSNGVEMARRTAEAVLAHIGS